MTTCASVLPNSRVPPPLIVAAPVPVTAASTTTVPPFAVNVPELISLSSIVSVPPAVASNSPRLVAVLPVLMMIDSPLALALMVPAAAFTRLRFWSPCPIMPLPLIVLSRLIRVAPVPGWPMIRLTLVGPSISTTPPPKAVTVPSMISVGSLSRIVPALLMLWAIVNEPPGSISKVAPAPITRLPAAAGVFRVTLTGTRSSTVFSAPGTAPLLQFGPVFQSPPEEDTH